MDPRIVNAYQSLRSLIEENAESSPAAVIPWHTTQVPLPLEDDEISGTDMLALWLPDMATESASAHPWQAYFRDGAQAVDTVPSSGDAPTPRPTLFPASPAMTGPLEKLSPSVLPPTEQLPSEDALGDEEAAAAIDGLYALIHAIGRLDIEGAMACVAESYHCIEGDRAIDRGGFRLWLDALLDRLRGFDAFEVFLAEIPEAIPHPRGVLIHAVVQIDGQTLTDQGTMAKSSLQLERLALLNREPGGAWTLDAFALAERLQS